MLKSINPADPVTAARLVELLGQHTPWYRSLWSIGVTLTIAELLEASTAHESGILSEGSVRKLASSCATVAGKDPVLTRPEKATLRQQLQSVPRSTGLSFFTLQQLRTRVERDYLLRWANAFRVAPMDRSERPARSIAAHLLDCGFSDKFLHGWFKQKLYTDPGELTLSELCEEANSAIATKAPHQFDVLIAFKHSPRSASGYPREWLNAARISEWLKHSGFSTTPHLQEITVDHVLETTKGVEALRKSKIVAADDEDNLRKIILTKFRKKVIDNTVAPRMSYGDYVEQHTYLLFLKMADERSKPPYNQPSMIAKKYAWPTHD